MKCLNCNERNAISHPPLGYLPCAPCQARASTLPHPACSQELTTDEIKTQRKAFKQDILQPFREGRLSKEYITQHGTTNLKVTPEEVAKAQNVWDGVIDYYHSD